MINLNDIDTNNLDEVFAKMSSEQVAESLEEFEEAYEITTTHLRNMMYAIQALNINPSVAVGMLVLRTTELTGFMPDSMFDLLVKAGREAGVGKFAAHKKQHGG